MAKGNGFENATYIGHAVIQMRDGQLVAGVGFKPAKINTFPVLGGTDAYEGAHGIAREVDDGTGALATVRLLP